MLRSTARSFLSCKLKGREREKEDQFEDQFGADLDRVRHFLQGKGKIGGGDIFNKDALEAKEAKKEDEDDLQNGNWK